jgi:AAA family ATP:ADP antiporter
MVRRESQALLRGRRSERGASRQIALLQPRESDRVQAAVLGGAVFAVLASYYLVKPAREALLATTTLDVSRLELRAAALVAQGICALVMATAYARLADRLQRHLLLAAVNGVFAAGLAAVALIRWHFQSPHFDLLVYIAAGALGAIVIAQLWAFVTDLEGRRAGRLLPLLSLAASAGGAAGAWAASRVIQAISDPSPALFLVAAAALCIATALSMAAARRRQSTAEVSAAVGKTESSGGGLGTVLRHRYLLGTALVALLAQWVSTNGDNLLFGIVQQSLSVQAADLGIVAGVLRETHIAHGTMAFYANFFLWSNLAALLAQTAVVIGCARGRSGRGLLLVLPVVTLASSAAMLFLPALGSLKILKVTENAARYSVNNTAAQMLWLPTTAEMKYKAKILIDSVVVRLADALAALTALLGLSWLQGSLHTLLILNLLLVLAWLVATAALAVEHNRRMRAATAPIGRMGSRLPVTPTLPLAA